MPSSSRFQVANEPTQENGSQCAWNRLMHILQGADQGFHLDFTLSTLRDASVHRLFRAKLYVTHLVCPTITLS
jgi:hypothetical protein